ncbi:MAG TPA: hypothetical protein VN540_05045 [Clostridia bacterium]|nr:hypothetical protein [Clostridia bacterium]
MKPWLKASLIKFWFYGAVYFFVGWGLFLASGDQLDLIVVLGLAMGAVNDLAVNRIFRNMETARLEYHPYMMVPAKAFYAFWLNLLYGLALSILVALFYQFANIVIIRLFELSEESVPLGAEPILYGIVAMLLDIGLVRLFRYALPAFVRKRREDSAAQSGGGKE